MAENTDAAIEQATSYAHIKNYSGKYTSLGGGEVNDTYLLDCGPDQYVLRVGRYSDVNILDQEARALRLLNLNQVPKLIFFDPSLRINDRLWIIESYIKGSPVEKLSLGQYQSLGELLAKIHKVCSKEITKLDFWQYLLGASTHFGVEHDFLNHPDQKLRDVIRRGYDYLNAQSANFPPLHESLIHGDATPSNILASGDQVSLIDWEFSKFKDPMSDLSTIYYEDMEYNKGKWRVHIKPEERQVLFAGYRKAGGELDEQRLAVWINLDKLGAAIFLYWRVHQAGRDDSPDQIAQYKLDLENITNSLNHSLDPSQW